MTIRIRHLRLTGVARNYDVSFVTSAGLRNLSVVAGEISTGKSSVLELIDFCLGASSHPRHHEIERQARTALLEVDLSGEVVVIERPLFAAHSAAFIHQCAITELDEPHAKLRRPISPSGDPQSLSNLLLENCGLAGISLKEAPTRSDSKTDPLSFRDIMWLCFLSKDRIGSRQLMHEASYMQEIKLRQVIEVVFAIHDDQVAQVGDAINAAQERRRDFQAEIRALEAFLEEHAIKSPTDLQDDLRQIAEAAAILDGRLSELDRAMRAATSFGTEQRRRYTEARKKARDANAIVRDRETLLQRLIPLRGQYAEDERKLVFYDEARALFDPLRVTVCPSCLQTLPDQSTIRDGNCTLCGQHVEPSEEPIDVAAELGATRSRRRELDSYIDLVGKQAREAAATLDLARREELAAQSALDSSVSAQLAPFVGERDEVIREREQLRARRAEIDRDASLHDGLARRRGEVVQVEARLAALRERLRELESTRPSREGVVTDLSARFTALLQSFGFPKLFDPAPPQIDGQFVPHIRGLKYREVGSTGATTLATLAWSLAILQRAVEVGASHPGFLLIDGPQKGLTPTQDTKADEYSDPAIADRMWHTLARVSSELGSGAQLIVVDNLPSTRVADDVVVRYSGKGDQPPYGLIDNETG
jgi:hypothetical protein